MNIESIQTLFKAEKVRWSVHCVERMQERNISYNDVENCILFGEIIEDYPDDFPNPSCLIFGNDIGGKALHTVVGSDGETLYIITAYYPSADKFDSDLKTRKET